MGTIKPTLIAGAMSGEPDEPYAWLAPEDGSRVPLADLAGMPVPEKNAVSIIAAFDPEASGRAGAFMNPIFFDPDYGALTVAEREFIGVVVSAANSCVTCLIIHSHKLGELIGDHARARRIAVNYRSVRLSPEERAIADYCIKVTRHPGELEHADIAKLREAGLSDRKIYYLVELAACYNLTNRLTSSYGMRPDDEFFDQMYANTDHVSPPT